MVYKYRVFLKFENGWENIMCIKSSHKTARCLAYDIITAKKEPDKLVMFETLDDSIYVYKAKSILEFQITPMED